MTDAAVTARPTPADVWAEMREGNARFVAGEPRHPRQDVERRHVLAAAQTLSLIHISEPTRPY